MGLIIVPVSSLTMILYRERVRHQMRGAPDCAWEYAFFSKLKRALRAVESESGEWVAPD